MNFVNRLPFPGNLVRSRYGIFSTGRSFAATIETNSVVLQTPVFDSQGIFNGFLISDSELHQALMRAIKYSDIMPRDEYVKSSDVGNLVHYHAQNKRGASTFTELHAFDFVRDGVVNTYAFTQNELEGIINRSKSADKSIVRPSVFQKFLIEMFVPSKFYWRSK